MTRTASQLTLAVSMVHADSWWNVTSVHRITSLFISEEWTSVQFCPRPVDSQNVQVWKKKPHWHRWWAELVDG